MQKGTEEIQSLFQWCSAPLSLKWRWDFVSHSPKAPTTLAMPLRLQVPVKHHHLDFVAHGHVALGMAQHDQAVGLHHGTEHA
jgi:hypothetical protein